MILPLSGLLIGAIVGALRARARGGKPADMVQWAIAHALAFGLAGLFILIFYSRATT